MLEWELRGQGNTRMGSNMRYGALVVATGLWVVGVPPGGCLDEALRPVSRRASQKPERNVSVKACAVHAAGSNRPWRMR